MTIYGMHSLSLISDHARILAKVLFIIKGAQHDDIMVTTTFISISSVVVIEATIVCVSQSPTPTSVLELLI